MTTFWSTLRAAAYDRIRRHTASNVFKGNPTLNQRQYRAPLIHNGMSRPLSVSCETINICNYKCVMCPYAVMQRPKEIMTNDVFHRVLEDYSAMGGGTISIHPVVGDIFLDKKLPDRIALLRDYPLVGPAFFVTNAVFSDRFDDTTLRFIVENVEHLRISVYGIDREEHKAITKVDDFDRFVESFKRLMRTVAAVAPKRIVQLSVTLFQDRPRQDVGEWLESVLGRDLMKSVRWGVQPPLSNFGGSINEESLESLGATMLPRAKNATSCFKTLNIRIFSNGDVSACPCADFDRSDDLHLGNIKSKTLLEMYNSERVAQLFSLSTFEAMPDVCKHCTFHTPIAALEKRKDLQQKFTYAARHISA